MNEQIAAKLEALKKLYAQSLPSKINEIEEHWNKVKLNFSQSLLNDFHRTVHSLVGSAGTYGFDSLSKSCRDLDIYLQQLLSCPDLKLSQKKEITHLIECIKEHDAE